MKPPSAATEDGIFLPREAGRKEDSMSILTRKRWLVELALNVFWIMITLVLAVIFG